MRQPSLFDVVEGERQKELALTQAAAHASAAWLDEALATVLAVARTHAEFTGADIWQAGLEKPEEPRRLGVVMRLATTQGLIAPTGRYRKSAIPSQHRQPLQI